jgi:hypothetical protein
MYFRITIFFCLFLFNNLVFAGIFDNSVSGDVKELEENFELSEESEENIDEENSRSILPKAKESSIIQPSNARIAEVVALNKVTSKSERLSMKIGEHTFFGNIEITAYKCIKSHDIYNPIDKILIKIEEHKSDLDPENIFQGWLLSSNPGISGLTHPVYEVIAIGCK